MSSLRFPLRVLSIALGLVLVSPAHAGDWYVDAINGSDANSGASPAAAWRTITHAVAVIATLPLDVQGIHVAPGVYNAAIGEAFPLSLLPKTYISGTQGSAQTILEGPAPTLLEFGAWLNTVPMGPESGADGLTLRQSGTALLIYARNQFTPAFWDIRIEDVGTGLSVSGAGGNYLPTFEDIWIENASGAAVDVYAYATGPFPGDGLEPIFDRLEVLNCAVGASVHSHGSSGSLFGAGAGIVLRDSTIRGSLNDGIRYTASGLGSVTASTSVHLLRCRIFDSGGQAAYGSDFNGTSSVSLTADACLFAGSQGCGLLTDGYPYFSHVTLNDCTVAGNLVCGVRGAGGQHAALRNSILARNGDDLDVDASQLAASYTDCADGDLAGFPNCFAADPQFVNARVEDFRLRFGSACAESGDPAASGHLDLLRHTRTLDGDLDTLAAADMGAFEFEPLHLVGRPALGETIGFEFWGPAGGSSALWMAPAPLTAPQSTTFGSFYLDPSMAQSTGIVPVRPGRPYLLRRVVPNDPLLVGRTLSFQGLTDSSAAPLGQAYTNAISFVVLP